jgi:hypothetical protein
MASPQDIRTDAPGMLRTEAMGITLRFDRTGPTTGRISWNIPRPATGCAAEDQAYCGIVVTLDTTSNNTTKLPVNGTVYSSDATGDTNLFAGDTIGSSKVIGAFYRDRTTTFFDVTGIKENTPYFVSGFPVDCENRYYREGVHAYSLDYKQDGTQPTHGTQVMILNIAGGNGGGVQPTDTTGLITGTDYTFEMKRGLVPKPNRPLTQQECMPSPWRYTITIPGAAAATYFDLLAAIQQKLDVLDNPPQGPTAPNTGAYYYNITTGELSVWNGSIHTIQPVIIQPTAPNLAAVGTFWLNSTTNVLNRYNGTAWLPVTVVSYKADPAAPQCDATFWFNGTDGFTWTGNAWLKHTLYNQTIDPSLFKEPPCGSFWYNTRTYELSTWDETRQMWVSANAVQSGIAPNALPTGAFWFDDTNKTLNIRNATTTSWTVEPTARIAETEPTLTVVAGTLWYNPATTILKQRDPANAAWVEIDAITFATDPTQVTYCSNWWSTVDDKMRVWDGVNNVWSLVANFWQQPVDPTAPPAFAEGDLWYQPLTQKLYYWQNNCFKVTDYVSWPTDPRAIPAGTVWHDTTNDLWFERVGTAWVPFIPTKAPADPTTLPTGTLWINSVNNNLQMWNGVSWVSVSYSTAPLTPSTGTKWYNTTTHKLMSWDGYNWVFATPLLTVDFNCYGNFIFTDTSTGSLSWVSVQDIDLFASLTGGFNFGDPSPGSDGVSSEPSYNEIGIGTDGTNDERLALQTEIRYALGYPTVDVEITPEQLNFCIDTALQTFRSNSSAAYTRGFFFLQLHAEHQTYLLTNKVSGMNKIVDVLGVHRLTSSFLSSAHGAGVYGQIVMQHLYNMGTFDLLSYHLMSEYTKTMEILFAGRITFNWNEQSRELRLHHRFPFSERMCLVEATVERTEQQMLSDRIARPWLRKWASAEAMMILANTRGKFQTLPGAGGGVSLNASDLRQQATTDKELCMAEIFDYVSDTPEDFGMQTTFCFG